MSSSTSDPNPKAPTLDAAIERESLIYITKFGLPSSVAQHIDSRLILHDVHINEPTNIFIFFLLFFIQESIISYW